MSHAAVAGLEGHAIQPDGAVDGEVSVVELHGEAAEGVVPVGIGVRHGVLARERERLHLARKCHDGRNGVLGSVCGVAFGRAGLDPRREDIELILRGLVDALEVVLWGAVLSAACAEGRHEEWVCAVPLGLHLREQAGSEGLHLGILLEREGGSHRGCAVVALLAVLADDGQDVRVERGAGFWARRRGLGCFFIAATGRRQQD